jgi:hypothetical protein
MTEQRDPRVDPRPGDVLDQCRIVRFDEHGNMYYTNLHPMSDGGEVRVARRKVSAWAKTATVVKKGDQP